MNVISITGGKGGIGKTTISVNLAVAFAKLGKRVLVFDADLGLANIDVLLGLTPKRTIYDFVTGKCTLDEVCMTGPYGIKIIPSASGIQSLTELSPAAAFDIIRSFSTLSDSVDILLIDMAAGISKQVIHFTHASQNILLTVCNDPSSMIDSYAVIKILHQMHGRDKFGIVINKVKNMQEGYQVFSKFHETITRFMNVSIEYLGYIPQDDYIGMAARENASVVDRFSFAPSAIAFQDLSRGVISWMEENSISGGIQFFFEKLINPSAKNEGDLCEV